MTAKKTKFQVGDLILYKKPQVQVVAIVKKIAERTYAVNSTTLCYVCHVLSVRAPANEPMWLRYESENSVVFDRTSWLEKEFKKIG